MSASDDIVSRADSLMKRRRSFVAGQPAAEQAPAPDEDEDLPVLTEIVAPEAALAEAPPDRLDDTQLALQAADLAQAVQQRLAAELPDLIDACLALVEREIQEGIADIVDNALKAFIAQRQPAAPPPDEFE